MKSILSIITVSYGQAQQVRALLQSLKKFPPSVAWELLVVDNHSPKPQQYDFLKSEKNTHLIELHHNIGFGKGNEEAVRFAQGNILAFINPDVEVQKNCLDELLTALKKEKNIGITAPVLCTKDGRPLENTWDFPTFWGLLRRRLWKSPEIQKHNQENIKDVDWAQGSFLVMQKDFFCALGFDHRFFLFFEDTDLCRRTWRKKKKVVQVPTARAYHTEHRLSGGHILTALFKRTFWIHLGSACKYFWKYRNNDK